MNWAYASSEQIIAWFVLILPVFFNHIKGINIAYCIIDVNSIIHYFIKLNLKGHVSIIRYVVYKDRQKS